MKKNGMAASRERRPWRFYGRQDDIRDVRHLLQLDWALAERDFDAFGLRGRRGVGKTELVKETLRRHGSDTPCLFVEMDEGPQAHPLVFLRSVRDALAQKGLEALLDDQPPRRRHCSDELHFVETLQWLLRRDMIIVLDEFHNCRGTGVPAKLKLMIDDQESTSPSYPLRGRLAVMGSHQQQFQDMFAETEPLHGRIRIKKALEPWTFRTIWDMAQDQGWDRHSRRLHTLWTAYGGLPMLWRRLARDHDVPDHLRRWPGPTDSATSLAEETQWLMDLLRFERDCIRQDPRLAWDSKARIELKEPLRSTLIVLGNQRSAGVMRPTSYLVERLRERARDSGQDLDRLPAPDMLRCHLRRLKAQTGLLARRAFFTGQTPAPSDRTPTETWVIDDNPTLFQIRALSLLLRATRSPDEEEGVDARACKRLERLEGDLLERLAAAWLKQHPQCRWSHWSVRAPDISGARRDIDALARLWPELDRKADGGSDVLICVNAKRSSSGHDAADFQALVDQFMAAADHDPDILKLRDLPRCHLFVSPQMEPADRKRLEAAGHLAFDWPTMAAELQAGWPLIRQTLERLCPPAKPAAETQPDA